MQIPENELYVSDSFVDDVHEHEYRYLQDAINAVPEWGKYLIKLKSDILDLKEIRLTNDNVNIRIDGSGQYGIMFGLLEDLICNIGDGKTLKFTNMTYIRGKTINIEQDGANIYFENCKNVVVTIKLCRGRHSNLYIKGSKIYGADDNPTIEIQNDQSKVEISDSFIKGSFRYPAIFFNRTESDKNVKIKNSTILGYDAKSIVSDERVGLLMYNCNGISRLDNSVVVNYIYDNNELIDSEITF